MASASGPAPRWNSRLQIMTCSHSFSCKPLLVILILWPRPSIVLCDCTRMFLAMLMVPDTSNTIQSGSVFLQPSRSVPCPSSTQNHHKPVSCILSQQGTRESISKVLIKTSWLLHILILSYNRFESQNTQIRPSDIVTNEKRVILAFPDANEHLQIRSRAFKNSLTLSADLGMLGTQSRRGRFDKSQILLGPIDLVLSRLCSRKSTFWSWKISSNKFWPLFLIH